MNDATTVYLYVDEDWYALYVGITGNGHRRAEQHRSSKAWWADVEAAYFVHMPSREEALRLEAALIGAINPVGNTIHSRGGPPVKIGPQFIKRLKSLSAGGRQQMLGDLLGRLMIDLLGPQGYVDSLPTIKAKSGAVRRMSREEYMFIRCEVCGAGHGPNWTTQGLFCPDCWDNRRVNIKLLERELANR